MQPPRSRVAPACWLIVLAVAETVAFAMIYRFSVTTVYGQRLEALALHGSFIGRERIDALARDVLNVVSVGSLAAVTIAIGFIALARRRFLLAFVAAMMIGGANLTTQLLKYDLLPRPNFGIDPGGPTGPSLPSGHTTVAMTAAVALVLVLPPRLRGTVAILGAGYAAATGVATLSVGWHRPSDVICAYLVVGIWTALAGLILLAAQDRRARPTLQDAHPVAVVLLAACGIGVLALGVLATAWADPGGAVAVTEVSRPRLFTAYFGGGAMVAGSAALVMSLVLVSMHRVVPSQRTGDPSSATTLSAVPAADAGF